MSLSFRWEYVIPGYGQVRLLSDLWKETNAKGPAPSRPPQLSCYGRAVPLVYGKTRIAGNVIYFQDGTMPTGQAITISMLPGSQVAVALCEGTIVGVDRVWRGKDMQHITDGAGFVAGMQVLTGTRPTQTPWSGFAAARSLGYPGIAMVCVAAVQPVADSLGQLSWEVKGLLHATGDATNGDADPSQILSGASSMLTNTDFGARFPWTVNVATGRDGASASSYATYAKALGLWISPAFTEQRAASDYLKDVLDATNGTCLWTSGLLEIVPLGDQAATGNGVTYTPALTVQYALSKDDFLAQKDGSRVQLELPPVSDVYNISPVNFLERSPTSAATDPANAYNRSVEDGGGEPTDIAVRGERRAPGVSFDSICQRSVALTIARIRAQRMVQTRNRYRFRIPWRFALLEPLDFVSVTDDELGLSAVVVRIEKIEEDPKDYSLDVTAVEWPIGASAVPVYTTQSSDTTKPTIGTYSNEARIHETMAGIWTARTIPAGTYGGVAWNGTVFCAVGTNICITSPDGVAWTTRTIPAGTYQAITWNGSVFCAVGSTGACATSPDGITWTARTIPAGSYYGIAWNGSLFVAVGASVCATSPDGITWTARTIPAGTYYAAAWGASTWVAVGLSGACASSPDAITWTARTIVTPGDYYAITYGLSNFVAVGTQLFGGTQLPRTAFSPDGVTWTQGTTVAIVGSGVMKGLVCTGIIFVALDADAGAPGRVFTSRDGANWQALSQFLPSNSYDMAVWNGRGLVAIAATTGACATSAPV